MAIGKPYNPMAVLLAIDIFAFSRQHIATGEFRPMPLFPPLFISAVVVGNSQGCEKHSGKGDNDGLHFHGDSACDGVESGEVQHNRRW